MKRKGLLLLLTGISLMAILAVLPFMSACKAPTPEVKTLQIGGLFALTGPFSSAEATAAKSVQIAVEMYNERGGLTIDGQKYMVEIVIEDMQSTVDGTVGACNRLVYDKGIKFIVGGMGPFSAAAATVCEPAKVLRSTVYLSSMPGELGPDTPYCFSGGNSILEYAVAGAKYIKQTYPDVKTLAEVQMNDGGIPFLHAQIEEIIPQYGFSLASEVVGYPPETIDYSPFVAKLIQLNPDAIFHIKAMPDNVGSILKGLRQSGWNKLYAASTDLAGSQIIGISGEAAATNAFTLSPLLGAPGNPPIVDNYLERAVGYESGMPAFNAVWTMLEAIQVAQSLDPTVVRDTWEKLDTIETAYGTGLMGGQQTWGVNHAVCHPVPVQLIDNGEVKFGAWIEVQIP